MVPVMILNGRRIEQRTEIAQEGGAEWLLDHLRMSGFAPFEIDGRDPAAFAWAILEGERMTDDFAAGDRNYPAPLPYAVAHAPKGFGFPGAATNRAHNLPLAGNPRTDRAAQDEFNAGAGALFVPPDDLEVAVAAFSLHQSQGRPLERDHPLAVRRPPTPELPEPEWLAAPGPASSAMQAIDGYFVRLADANPGLRVRLGNPDELRSNQMGGTLERLRPRA